MNPKGALSRLELLALMAAIVYWQSDDTVDAVERADEILRAAEHKYPADRPEEAVLAKGATA